MKWMNNKVLEWEQGTVGYPEEMLYVAEINAALNAWAKRKGITWGPAYARSTQQQLFAKRKHKHHENTHDQT